MLQAPMFEAVNAGGGLAAGGYRLDDTLFKPAVIVARRPAPRCRGMKSSVLSYALYGYDDIDAAIAQANALPYAFQAAVFTERLSVANHCIRALAGSAVLVNDHTAFRTDWMPFAGLRQSGLGTGGIGYTMTDMTVQKMAVFKESAHLC